MIYMAWRGVAIGILISAPMGPVGILCIQRTLEKGRKAGLYTGIGASLSDLLYCLLTAFGLSFIEEFIERNQDIIQLFGSVVLICFSIYLFRKSPSSSLRRPVPQGVSARKNILGGFLFTFSNPLILLLTIGLFARFNFLMPEIQFYHYIIGFIFLMAGALVWWYGVTFVIDKIRKRFSYRTMKKINIGIGIVILIFAVVGIITGVMGLTSTAKAADHRYWNEVRGYAPFADTTGVRSVTLHNDKAAPAVFSVYTGDVPDSVSPGDVLRSAIHTAGAPVDFRFTIGNEAAHPMRRYSAKDAGGKTMRSHLPAWGMYMASDKGESVAIMLQLREIDEMTGLQLAMIPSITAYSEHDTITTEYPPVREGINLGAEENRFRLTLRDGHLHLSGGRRCDTDIVIAELNGFKADSIGFILSPGAAVRVSDIVLDIGDTPHYNISHDAFPDLVTLRDYLSRQKDLTEGYWQLWDYDLDNDLLRCGGDYRVAIVKRDNGYDILYLSGASTMASLWQPLMIKGELHNTPIEGVYDLTWYDATGSPMSHGLKAQRQDDDILTLHFPAQSSTLRLHRISAP
ncbi:MAG: LysE family translocator [Muribaculaceae bacterium]|nr:LysE family translocator [Muribaculaceae bacterium]